MEPSINGLDKIRSSLDFLRDWNLMGYLTLTDGAGFLSMCAQTSRHVLQSEKERLQRYIRFGTEDVSLDPQKRWKIVVNFCGQRGPTNTERGRASGFFIVKMLMPLGWCPSCSTPQGAL